MEGLISTVSIPLSIIFGLLVGHIVGLVSVRLIPCIISFGKDCYTKRYRSSIKGKEKKYYNRMLVYPLAETVIAVIALTIVCVLGYKKFNMWVAAFMVVIPFIYHWFKVTQEKLSREIMTQIIRIRHVINDTPSFTSKMVANYNKELDKIYNEYIHCNKYQKVKANERAMMKSEELIEKMSIVIADDVGDMNKTVKEIKSITEEMQDMKG